MAYEGRMGRAIVPDLPFTVYFVIIISLLGVNLVHVVGRFCVISNVMSDLEFGLHKEA